MIFTKEGEDEPFWQSIFKEGVTFEWIKNKVAEEMEANYADLTLFEGERRIIEPFCPIDMGIKSGAQITVKIAEGAVLGNEELRQQVLAEIAEAEAAEKLKDDEQEDKE